MDRFTADLHIHSRFSRATSKNLNLRGLAAWARVKGLDVLGTGDFTHPEWIAEMREELKEDGRGLLRLKDETDLAREIDTLALLPGGSTRFLLQAEISSIYKRGGKTRKVHNLVYMPTFEAAEKLNRKLAAIGNIASDGRPILGLDSRNLLEMVLETDPLAYLVPAHIWTPWFSLFGSKSGFDSVEECYGDLAEHIFAMETGLSSDPEMNWTWSHLDRYRLISNSDAHSGEKLGREANLFQGERSYEGIYRALRDEGIGQKFLGTIEFFPEEGKYHLDGHRKCGVVMDPQETRARGGLCPVCGKPVTRGVFSRIAELADREEPQRPKGQPGFTSLIPLKEVLGEVLGVGPGSKKVGEAYSRLVADLGSELAILRRVPPEDLKRHNPHLAEGITRMREGQVLRQPGYDGEYGVISVFTPAERQRIKSGATLVEMPAPAARSPRTEKDAPAPASPPDEDPEPQAAMAVRVAPGAAEAAREVRFNDAQLRAVQAGPGPVLVLAGPGTGKTQTLLGRIRRLMEADVKPRRILALTFTRRAARELRERLETSLGLAQGDPLPQAGTLHALAFEFWKHAYGESPVVLSEGAARRIFRETAPDLPAREADQAFDAFNLARERREDPGPELTAMAHRYTKQKESWNLADYTDLLEFYLEQSQGDHFHPIHHHVLVDEVQDLSPLQLELIAKLTPEGGAGFFAIGDPLQSIYSFRGAAGDVAERLRGYWPKLETITLTENYRSGQTVLDAAQGLFPQAQKLRSQAEEQGRVHLFNAPDGMREAAWISERVKRLIGATSHSLTDAGEAGRLTPGEIAVLVRFKGLVPKIRKALERHGIPVSVPEAEAFWNEPRIAAILGAAGRILGLACQEDDEHCYDFPERVLAGGPGAIRAHLESLGDFDPSFWQSRAYREFRSAFEEHGGWTGLMNWVNLQTDLEHASQAAEKVQVMTLHASKGLEFEAVFLPALEDGILPFAGPGLLSGNLQGAPGMNVEEERRLFFVGMTRARSELYLSYATRRMQYGQNLQLPPCRYLAELPKGLVSRSTLAARKVQKQRQISLLD
jgi:uncharacterized protein (TIGR00375 family)